MIDQLVDQILGELSEHYNEAMKYIAKKSELGEELCHCGAGASVNAGAKYGPTTIEELVRELGPDVATTLMFDVALGSPPVGLVLSIPGVTQVQYYYKGLINGPENRSFDIKGKVAGNNLYLDLSGDVKGGDKNLTIEYMVNYKKDRAKFPCWSPFLDEPADLFTKGDEVLYEFITVPKIFPLKDEDTGKITEITVPEKRTVKKIVKHEGPFAVFHKNGTHRNNKSMWHEYEYTWRAYKLTTPLTEEEIKKDKEKVEREKFIRTKIEELKLTGKTTIDIDFNPGQNSTDPGAEGTIKDIAEIIKNFPKDKFTISACCDTSTDSMLSLSRSKFIVDLLVKEGIKKSQLQPMSCSLLPDDKTKNENNLCTVYVERINERRKK